MIIAFSFLSLLSENYKNSIIKFNSFNKNNWLHYDVMDGQFVGNKTFDHRLVGEISKYNKLFNDVHLMIENPIDYIEKYVSNGADQITFHYESISKDKIQDVIRKIKKLNVKVGISIKPSTKVEVLDDYLCDLDYILIMSVEPGKGGQKFMESCIDKIKYLKSKKSDNHYLIGVDGGIDNTTSKLVKDAGADVVVIGTYLANNLNSGTIDICK